MSMADTISPNTRPPTRSDMSVARRAMIDSQLRTSGVNTGFVLTRMGSVAREDYVPEPARSTAYMDRAIPLGDGQYLGAPVMHGKMLEAADPQPADRVLIVSGGSEYLAELVRPMVATLDIVTADEAVAASQSAGDYTLLMIDGAIEQFPDALGNRLADQARVVSGMVERGITKIVVGRKIGASVGLLPIAEMGVPLLPAFAKPKSWTF